MTTADLSLSDVARALNVSEAAADVFVALRVHGSTKKSDIVKLLGRNEKEVTDALQELRDHKLITSGMLSYFVSPNEQLLSLGIDGLEKVLKFTGTLTDTHDGSVPTLGLVRCEGHEGIQEAYIEVLEEAVRTGGSILALESGLDAEELDEFFEDYIRQRKDAGVTAYVITPNEEQDKEYKDEHEGEFTHVKLIDNFPIAANINIVGNLVMTYNLSPAQGTLRRDRGEATTLKALFWKMWECGNGC